VLAEVDLITRFGGGTADSSLDDLKEALRELYIENHPSLVEEDYKEHPNTWLNYGYENGNKWIVYTLDIYRGGMVIFSKRDDQDNLAPEFEKRMTGVSQESALELWKALASGNIDTLMVEPWLQEK
jgi:hypothetical protein